MQILCLCVGIFVFSQFSTNHAKHSHESTLHRLSYTDVSIKMKAFSELNALYASAKQEMNATLNAELKQLTKITKSFVSRMDKLEDVDPMLNDCVRNVRRISNRSPHGATSANDMAVAAIYEKQNVYDKIVSDTYEACRKKLQRIASDVIDFGVKHDCEKNETCSRKIMEMVESLPRAYQAEQELAQAIFLEAEYAYRDRVHDYADELRKRIKPYVTMLDHCLRQYLRA